MHPSHRQHQQAKPRAAVAVVVVVVAPLPRVLGGQEATFALGTDHALAYRHQTPSKRIPLICY